VLEIFHKELVGENSSVIFAALSLETREKCNTFELVFWGQSESVVLAVFQSLNVQHIPTAFCRLTPAYFGLLLMDEPAMVAERLAEAPRGWEDAGLHPSHTNTLNCDSLPVREPLPH
jgi:hypothetical protein